jgi:hypothetical protein
MPPRNDFGKAPLVSSGFDRFFDRFDERDASGFARKQAGPHVSKEGLNASIE